MTPTEPDNPATKHKHAKAARQTAWDSSWPMAAGVPTPRQPEDAATTHTQPQSVIAWA